MSNQKVIVNVKKLVIYQYKKNYLPYLNNAVAAFQNYNAVDFGSYTKQI